MFCQLRLCPAFYLFVKFVKSDARNLGKPRLLAEMAPGQDSDSGTELGVIFGTEHPWFWRIHFTALVSLGMYLTLRSMCEGDVFT